MSNSAESSPHEQFIIDLKKFTAVTAVGVQALRRQGVGAIGHIQTTWTHWIWHMRASRSYRELISTLGLWVNNENDE